MANGGEVRVKFTGDIADIRSKIALVKGEINTMNRSMGQISAPMKNANKGVKTLSKSTLHATKSVKGLEIGFNQMYRTLFNVKTIALVLFGGMVREIVKADAAAQGLTATLQAVTKDDKRGSALFDSLSVFARRMPVDTETIISEYVKLYNRGIVPTTEKLERLIDVSSALGGTNMTAKFGTLSKAMGDVAAKGRLMGQEVRQFTEAGVNIQDVLKLIPRLEGKNVAGDYSAAAISWEEFDKAFMQFAKNNFAGVAKKKMETLQGSIEVFNDTLFRTKRALGMGGVSTAMQEFLNIMSATLTETGIGGSDAVTDLKNWGATFGAILSELLGGVTYLYTQFTRLNNSMREQGTFASGMLAGIAAGYNTVKTILNSVFSTFQKIAGLKGTTAEMVGQFMGLIMVMKTLKLASILTGLGAILLNVKKIGVAGWVMNTPFLLLAAGVLSVNAAFKALQLTVDKVNMDVQINALNKKLDLSKDKIKELSGMSYDDLTKESSASFRDSTSPMRRMMSGSNIELTPFGNNDFKTNEQLDQFRDRQIKSLTASMDKTKQELNGLYSSYDVKTPGEFLKEIFSMDIVGIINDAGISDAIAKSLGFGATEEAINLESALKKKIKTIQDMGLSDTAVSMLDILGIDPDGYDDKLHSYMKSFREGIAEEILASSDAWLQFAEVANSAFNSMDDAFSEFLDTGEVDFKAFTDAIVKDLLMIGWKELITLPLKNALLEATAGTGGAGGGGLFSTVVKSLAGAALGAVLPGEFMGFDASSGNTPTIKPTYTPNALGNAFSNGRVQAFAKGGVVDSATSFPMAGASTGLMGEAGPEAIMPLSRGANGKLGVNASSMAPSIIINTPPGYTAETEQNDRNETEIFIMRSKAFLSSTESDNAFKSASSRQSDKGVSTI